MLCKGFRESLYRRVFLVEIWKQFWPLFWSTRFWLLPRVYAQRHHHCDSRKAVQFTRETTLRQLAVVPRPFLPCSHSSHIADRSAHCPAWPPDALSAWNVRAPVLSATRNIQTTNTVSICHNPAGFCGLSCASCHRVYHRQLHSRWPGCLPWPGFSSFLFDLLLPI